VGVGNNQYKRRIIMHVYRFLNKDEEIIYGCEDRSVVIWKEVTG